MTDEELVYSESHLAYKTIVYIGTWVLGSMVWVVLDNPVNKMRDQAMGMAQTEAAQKGLQWIAFEAWDWFPLWIGILALILILSGAARESTRGF